jgi:molybdopterin biosynthesis enzyme
MPVSISQSGDSLLNRRVTLDAAAIALAAAAGRASLQVSRAQGRSVWAAATNSSLPGTPGADQIFDSMSFGIAALGRAMGRRSNTLRR